MMRTLLPSIAALFVMSACQPAAAPSDAASAAPDVQMSGAAAADAGVTATSAACQAAALVAVSSEPGRYSDGRGGFVEFPLGDISFADEIVSFQVGAPRAAEPNSQASSALGSPNYVETADDTYVTLGCAGILTLRFVDNALADGPGPDLYVFEVGPLVERMTLAISADGAAWTEVGAISGGRADIDISAQVQPGDVFHFVRLTDGRARCDGAWPGADVDAVGAVGAALQFSLNSEVLFDTGRAELKLAALAELDTLSARIGRYRQGRVTIEGHTDGVGADAANVTLSQNRAGAVQRYLQAKPELSAFEFTTHGYGETRPVASNENDEGRMQNRRVDVVLQPGAE